MYEEVKSMKQLAFFIDINKCISCHSCTYACSNEKDLKDTMRRKVLSITQQQVLDELHFSTSCHHCETPACMPVCRQNCFRKLRNGIVILESQNCIGCNKCVSACPFQAISINKNTKKADKCDMCYSLLQKGEQPICVQTCIADAISIRDIYEEYPSAYQASLKEYPIKSITQPSTRFKYNPPTKIKFWANESEDEK